MILKRLCFLSLAMVFSHYILAREIPLSEKPISLRMPVGKEYIVRFSQGVASAQVMDEQVSSSVGTLLSPDGVLYITPVEPFDKTRMVVQLIDGRLVMFDLVSALSGPYDDEHTKVLEKPIEAPKKTETPKDEVPEPEKNPYKPDFLKDGGQMTLSSTAVVPRGNDYHRLVQSAFQQYYGTVRSPMVGKALAVSPQDLSGLLRLNNGKLRFKVLQSRKIGEDYLTILLVNNLSQQSIHFDPRAIRGRWVFAATLHPTLTPSGTAHDRTLWALISQVPFEKARR